MTESGAWEIAYCFYSFRSQIFHLKINDKYTIIVAHANYQLTSIIPPGDQNLISSKPLSNPRVFQFSFLLGWFVLECSGIGYHCSIINCIPLVDTTHFSISLLHHIFYHFLESQVAAHPSHYYHLFWTAVAHSSFCHFHQHRENGFLKRKTKIFKSQILREFFFEFLPVDLLVFLSFSPFHLLFYIALDRVRQLQMWKQFNDIFHIRQNARKAHVHAFDSVRDINQNLSLPSKFLDVESRSGIVRNIGYSGKPIQAIPHCYVQSLPKYSVSLSSVGYDLRIASTHIENSRMNQTGCQSSHLDMTDAMVNSYEGNIPQKWESSCNQSADVEGRTHSRTFGIGNQGWVNKNILISFLGDTLA